ncbi:MAG TPA: AbrB family transcriptional regulator [Rhizomicrobium sp.]|jgi:putative addiction module antidote|nr:AbrB family transcriptional regulator [Rhizomicrobium sp.]
MLGKTKVIQIGNSVGVVLPKEALAMLRVERGDMLFLTQTANGVSLTAYDPGVEKQIEEGREFMREYRDTLRALAK